MVQNPFVNHFTQSNEQRLVESLIIESIQFYGIDCVYLPSTNVKLDSLFGEDVLRKFETKYTVEMYIKDNQGFGSQGDLIQKFGLEIKDNMTLTVARSRFEEATDGTLVRPLEGDLIYFPLTKQLFQIAFVEHEQQFYQLGTLYTYDIKVERLEYGHEIINTGDRDIDSTEDENAYSILLTLGALITTPTPNQYRVGEVVYQGANLNSATAKAQVSKHYIPDGKVTVNAIVGKFTTGNLIGVTSGTTYNVTGVDEFTMPTDPIAENKELNDATGIIDFSEDNPFSKIF